MRHRDQECQLATCGSVAAEVKGSRRTCCRAVDLPRIADRGRVASSPLLDYTWRGGTRRPCHGLAGHVRRGGPRKNPAVRWDVFLVHSGDGNPLHSSKTTIPSLQFFGRHTAGRSTRFSMNAKGAGSGLRLCQPSILVLMSSLLAVVVFFCRSRSCAARTEARSVSAPGRAGGGGQEFLIATSMEYVVSSSEQIGVLFLGESTCRFAVVPLLFGARPVCLPTICEPTAISELTAMARFCECSFSTIQSLASWCFAFPRACSAAPSKSGPSYATSSWQSSASSDKLASIL